MIWTLPNKLTVLRMILVPFFVAALLIQNGEVFALRMIALVLFLIASLTDLLDGKIARKYNLVTNFGKFMDPLADKLLVCSALICLVQLGQLPAWIVIIIISREFIISGFRLVAADQGVVIAASMWGKSKTVSQMIAIIVVLLNGWLLELSSMGVMKLGAGAENIIGIINLSLLWISGVLTVISGVIYIKDNFSFIKNAK